MKHLLAMLTAALLSAGVLACGDSSAGTATRHAASSTGASAENGSPASYQRDRDGDRDNNRDDEHILDFGVVAGTADSQAITALVSRYFADAANEDGAKACSLLTPFIAESIVEADGHAGGLRGNNCAMVVSKLFRQHHRELADKSSHLRVIRVGVEGDRSLAVLEFPEIHEIRQITLRHQGKWTVLDLFDGKIE
jgi:hypothetical protein